MRTNTKIVSNKIQEHIKEFYTIEALKQDIKTLTNSKTMPKTTYQAIEVMVEGGLFLIYNDDIKDFLNSLGINPENKEYDTQKSWDLYKHLIAREGVKLCEK